MITSAHYSPKGWNARACARFTDPAREPLSQTEVVTVVDVRIRELARKFRMDDRGVRQNYTLECHQANKLQLTRVSALISVCIHAVERVIVPA